MKTAVLVIDVQQGLCVGEGKAHDCEGLFANINRVTAQARSACVPVMFIQHESAAGYLEHGTPAWQLADGLHVSPGDIKIRKTTPDAFLRTDLARALNERQINHLVVCGMHTEFCVDTTTRQALARGYPVTLVSDAHTSAGNNALTPQQVIAHHNATLTNISSFGPRVTATACRALHIAPLTPIRPLQPRKAPHPRIHPATSGARMYLTVNDNQAIATPAAKRSMRPSPALSSFTAC